MLGLFIFGRDMHVTECHSSFKYRRATQLQPRPQYTTRILYHVIGRQMDDPFSALILLVGQQEGRLVCKKLGDGWLMATI